MIDVQVSLPLAFAAGVVSFLSPCILPVVPSYLAFVTGLTLEELGQGAATAGARVGGVLYATLFVLGFTLVFMTLGWAATSAGRAIAGALPWISRLGGALIVLFGLYLTGIFRPAALEREIRVHLSSRPAGAIGSFAAGLAFGAGWTPCIGPVLASILLYAGMEATAAEGTLLLSAYALGLGVPFVAAAAMFSWFVAGAAVVRRWLRPLERVAGALLVVIGLMMVTGSYAGVTAFLASLGQVINLEVR